MNRRIQARAGSTSIPLVVIGGPASASRTTLLQRLLTRNDGRRIAVVRDTSSALAYDPSLIERVEGSARVLRTGSVCYDVDGDASAALAELRVAPIPIECVVLEAGAGSSLQRTSGYAYMPGYRPGGTVLVTDAAATLPEIEEPPGDESTLARELGRAELVVLDDVDHVGNATRRSLRRWLQDHALRARIVECESGCVPTAMLLGIAPSRAPAHTRLGEWTPRFALEGDTRRNGTTVPRHDDDYRAWLLTIRGSIDARDFRDWVAALPDSIIRGDGELHLRGEDRQGFRFHQCGSRWTLTPEESPPESAPGWVSLVGMSPLTRPSPPGTPVAPITEPPSPHTP